jgi:UAA transporter family
VFIAGEGRSSLWLVMLFSVTGYLGVTCVTAITKGFGALTSAITTTTRKALTMALSFVFFPKVKA